MSRKSYEEMCENYERWRSDHQFRVDKFMRAAGQPVPPFPQEPDVDTRILRSRLILEEALETIEKGLGVSLFFEGRKISFGDLSLAVTGPFDMVATADGCADLRVVTTGTFSACGIADEPIQVEVDMNNLAKISGSRRYDEYGKLLKSPDHRPPDIAGILAAQGWKGQS